MRDIMVELPELNEDQRLYLQTVFDYFHKEGKWPTYLWVENTILHTHPEKRSEFDLAEMGKSLPDNFASGFSFNHQYRQEAAFIAPALYYFPEAKEEIDDFIRVIGFCVEKIITSVEERPAITSVDLSSQLHMQPLAIRKMGLLLISEPDISDGSSYSENWWQINLRRGKYGVRRFEGVETFEQYLEKRTALTRYFSGNVAAQPVYSELANDMPVVGVGDTQYHIVQGDQYNILGNVGEVKIKSPSTESAATKGENKSPWVSGSFYLVAFMVIIAVLAVIAHLLPIYALPIVLVGGILAVSIIGALQLRQDDRLNEENFLKLMALSLRYLPLVKGREAKPDRKSISTSANTSAPDDKTT